MLDAHVADDVLARLLVLDADAALRSRLMQRKCEEMERILSSLARLRAQKNSVREKEAEQQDMELGQVHETIDQVINRARRIRIEMARVKDQGEEDTDDTEGRDETQAGESTPRSLQEILAMAQSIRGVPSASKATIAAVPAASDPEPRFISVEYPHKWKTLMYQYEEMQARNREESFRFQFCRKLSEHVSMKMVAGPDHADKKFNDKSPPPPARVQVSFSKQAARLSQAYRLLGAYVDSSLSMESETCQKAITTPSMSTVVPTYRRLHHAKNLQRILESETNDLAQRMPSRPALSPEACCLRDQTLRRIRRKQGHVSTSTPTAVDNRTLLIASNHYLLPEHEELLRKLQVAWDNAQSPSATNAFSNTISEAVLTAMSGLILRAFQMQFCEGETREIKPSQIKDMMFLVRLVDSISKSNGRTYRSVITMRSSSEQSTDK